MHLKRAKSGLHLPVPRKGTTWLARAASHANEGVPVVIAIRDILKLARTSKEVKQMVNQGLLKLNGKKVNDIKEAVKLMNIIEADKKYMLRVLTTGRYALEETKKDTRICKVIGKTMQKKKTIQLNLHDGSNILTKEKANVGDSVEIGFDNKIKNVIKMEKGKKVLITSGSKVGQKGKINSYENGVAEIKLEDGEARLNSSQLVALG